MLGTVQESASGAFSSVRCGEVESQFHWSRDTEDQINFELADFYHIIWVLASRRSPAAQQQGNSKHDTGNPRRRGSLRELSIGPQK